MQILDVRKDHYYVCLKTIDCWPRESNIIGLEWAAEIYIL